MKERLKKLDSTLTQLAAKLDALSLHPPVTGIPDALQLTYHALSLMHLLICNIVNKLEPE